MSYQDYRDLKVWQEAMNLVVSCYRLTETFPKHELFGLISQLQRAAVSIPANIAEGQGRNYDGEFLKHLAIALGSLAELETHLQIAHRLGYIEEKQQNQAIEQTRQISRMIYGLRKSIQAKIANSRKPDAENALLKTEH
ncbi:MAG: four helix bundle protein [Phycisphaeraceae bacterium]|nr:four helix bundle protein [Phycisphaeraceae bacterium]